MSMSDNPDCRKSVDGTSGLASAIRGGIVTARFAGEIQKIEQRAKLSTVPVKARDNVIEEHKRVTKSRKKLRKVFRKLLRRCGLRR
jgi:hypothetical protein